MDDTPSLSQLNDCDSRRKMFISTRHCFAFGSLENKIKKKNKTQLEQRLLPKIMKTRKSLKYEYGER